MARRKATESWRNAIVRYADEPPESLLANPMNWRQHPQSQTQALVGSLNEVGWIAPVIVNETTQHVVDGHARIGEAISRGEATVPVAYVNLTEEQERLALATFDPIAAMAGTDQKMLDDLLAGISSPDGLEALLASLTTPEQKELGPDDADLTPPAEPITKPGDLWLLGEHRLLCGDATKAEDVTWLMGGEKADVVFTDPPYGISLDTDYTHMPESAIRSKTYDRVTGDDSAFDPRPLFALVDDVTEQFWWGGDYYYQHLPAGGSWLIWDKRNEASDGLIGNHFEVCWSRQHHRREMKRYHWAGFTAHDQSEPRSHPTQKPLELVVDILSGIGKANDVVLDLFLGSGTTLIAAEQLGRRCYAMEIEPAYVDVTVRRWEHVTGKKAQRA